MGVNDFLTFGFPLALSLSGCCVALVAAIYLTCTLAITTLSMVLTVLILNLHYTNDRPVPYWTRRIMLNYVARLLCMCREEDLTVDTESATDESTEDKTSAARVGLLNSLRVPLGTSLTVSEAPSDENVNTQPRFRNYQPVHARDITDPDDVFNLQQREAEWAIEWRRLGEVVDRIFFWVFTSATIISTLILFHPLTKAHFSLLGDERILKKKGT